MVNSGSLGSANVSASGLLSYEALNAGVDVLAYQASDGVAQALVPGYIAVIVTSTSTQAAGLTPGSIAGIVVGAVVAAVLLAALLGWFLYTRYAWAKFELEVRDEAPAAPPSLTVGAHSTRRS